MVRLPQTSRQMDPTLRTATILVNPTARRLRHGFDAPGAKRFLERRGIAACIAVPESAAAFEREAHRAAERGDDLLFSVGGDGTLRLAAGAIAGSDTALAVIPAGTADVWAKETGIPRRFRAAFEAHATGQRLRADLGRAGSEPFLLLASLGWDADIASHVGGRLKQMLGPGAYVLQGAARVPWMHPAPMRWHDDHGSHEAAVALMVIGNSRLYGGMVSFTPDAVVDDGLLDACILCPGRRGDGARLAAKLGRARLCGDPCTHCARSSRLAIETAGIPLEVDGDVAGYSPVEIRVEPRALLVSVPAGPTPAIFGAGEVTSRGS